MEHWRILEFGEMKWNIVAKLVKIIRLFKVRKSREEWESFTKFRYSELRLCCHRSSESLIFCRIGLQEFFVVLLGENLGHSSSFSEDAGSRQHKGCFPGNFPKKFPNISQCVLGTNYLRAETRFNSCPTFT